MNNAELVSRYRERFTHRPINGMFTDSMEDLGDTYFLYAASEIPLTGVNLSNLRKEWSYLRGEIMEIRMEKIAPGAGWEKYNYREFLFQALARGMHVRDEDESLPEFEFVQQIRSAVPRILGSEPEEWLGLETYAPGLRFTTGAAVLLAGFADLEKPELFTPERRRHIGEFVVRQNSFLDRNDSKIRVDGVASALALTFDWQPAPISRT